MSRVRAQVPEMNIDALFPKAQTRPISLQQAWRGVGQAELESDISRFAIGAEWRKLRQGQKSNKYLSLVKPSLSSPSPTLTKGAGMTLSLASVVHPVECRKYSRYEARRITSIPDEFVMSGSWSECLERLGNSVPPLFMRAIAGQIAYAMFGGAEPVQTLRAITDYPAHLEAAWLQHLAPREPDAPTVISTFAGAGGSSLGYSMAGYRELLAVEWDNNAVETFRLNFPGVPVYHGDIAKLSVDECMRLAGLTGPRQLDVLDGSPPCQGFSTAGKRDFKDDRNQLFREFVRLLRGLQPKVFVMENVSGMVKGKMKLIFADILRELKASGYVVSARLLNAMWFGVPQSRERMIFIGVREDLGIAPSHPKAQSRPVTTRGAIGNLSTKQDNAIDHIWIDEIARGTKWGNPTLVQAVKPGGKIRSNSTYIRLFWDKPCNTLTKAGLPGMPLYVSNCHIHPQENRALSVREFCRLASFPDKFVFINALTEANSRIGNSVPPLFMRAIALHVRREVLSGTSELVAVNSGVTTDHAT